MDENVAEKRLKELDTNSFNYEVSCFLRNQDEQTKILCRKIVDLLDSKKDNGLTLYQLKLELKEEYDDKTLKEAVELLESNDPALIVTVGFNSVRYVTSTYISTWCILTKEASMVTQKVKIEPGDVLFSQLAEDNVSKKDIIVPNLWMDINGNVTNLVLHECKAAVIDFILRRPGSSDASIYRKFEAAFDRRGLSNILDILVKQNAVKRVQVHHFTNNEAKNSIFSKSRTFKCSNEAVIANATQTFYWLQPHYYRSVG